MFVKSGVHWDILYDRCNKSIICFFKQQTNQESPGPSSPRRRGSPRQTGRGSPGARISWLTAAKSGVGGQVMLNDKGKYGREGTVGRVCVHLYWLVLDKEKALQK